MRNAQLCPVLTLRHARKLKQSVKGSGSIPVENVNTVRISRKEPQHPRCPPRDSSVDRSRNRGISRRCQRGSSGAELRPLFASNFYTNAAERCA